METTTDHLVQQINGLCDIVDREEQTIIGVAAELNAESKNNAYQIGKKYFRNGTMNYLAEVLGRETGAFFGVCTEARGAGHLRYTIGVAGDIPDTLPIELPEDCAVVMCPAGRYARMRVTDHASIDDNDVAMQAEEYFVGDFRHDTPYAYDISRHAYHQYAADGSLLAVYQPVKIPQSLYERFESIRIDIVGLPTLRCACSMLPIDTGIDVLWRYFAVQDQVKSLLSARDHDQEYWGFPYLKDGVLYSCFGSRVVDFHDVPDCVEHLTIPGGLCAHLTQAELNGDNPSMLYDVAFNHLQAIFFDAHPEYKWDDNRKVYARFRLGTSASIFVPIRRK